MTHFNGFNRSSMALALASLSVFSMPSRAEQAKVAADAGNVMSIEEVVVTARKVEESQQSLPISIAAFSAKDIEQSVVLSVSDLGNVVPGLVVAANSQGGAPTFAIRGTKTDNGVDGGVAVYLDDMPLISTYGIRESFYDIASVEILKGPQGTQFGTNTTGGTISVRAAKPTDKFEGYAQVGIGNYNRSEFEGMINAPVNDVLQLRLAGSVVNRDGFVKNLTPTGGRATAFSDDKHDSFRFSARIKPSATLTNDIVADYFHEDDQPRQAIPVAFNTGASIGGVPINPGAFGAKLGTWKTVSIGQDPSGVRNPLYNKHKTWGIQDVLNWEISDNVSIKNVIGYREDENHTREDNDATTLELVNGSTTLNNKEWVDDFTIRLNTDDKRLRGSGGVFVSSAERILAGDSNIDQNIFLGLAAVGVPPAFGGGPFVSQTKYWEKRELRSHAVYANVDYDLTKELTVSVGLRYNWDSGKFKYSWANGVSLPSNADTYFPTAAVPCSVSTVAALPDHTVPPAGCEGRSTGKWKAPSYNFVITDKFAEKALIYFKASGAYLAGGFNAGIRESGLQTFQPEKTYSFETGLKSDWELWSRPIRTNFDVFYGNSKNKQEVENGQYSDGASWIGVFNAGAMTFYGTDLEVKYFPVDGLELDGTWTHVESSYDNFNFPQVATIPAQDLSGNQPAQVPKDTVNLSVSYTWPLASDHGRFTTTFNTYYSSKVNFHDVVNLGGAFPSNADVSPDHWVSSFSANWKGIMGSNFDANFWVKNLFDKKYIIYSSAQAVLGYWTLNYGDPRTFGLNVRYNF